MTDIKALIAYMIDNEIEEVVWTFTDIDQAREYFVKNIKSPKDFYEGADVDKKQAMCLFVIDKIATLEWSVNQDLTIQHSSQEAKQK